MGVFGAITTANVPLVARTMYDCLEVPLLAHDTDNENNNDVVNQKMPLNKALLSALHSIISFTLGNTCVR